MACPKWTAQDYGTETVRKSSSTFDLSLFNQTCSNLEGQMITKFKGQIKLNKCSLISKVV